MRTTVDRRTIPASDDWWDELDTAVLEYLVRRGMASPAEVGAAVGLSAAAAASMLAMLACEGKVSITRVELVARPTAAAA